MCCILFIVVSVFCILYSVLCISVCCVCAYCVRSVCVSCVLCVLLCIYVYSVFYAGAYCFAVVLLRMCVSCAYVCAYRCVWCSVEVFCNQSDTPHVGILCGYMVRIIKYKKTQPLLNSNRFDFLNFFFVSK